MAHDLDSFMNSLIGIYFYDAVGYLEVADGKISNRPPLILPATGINHIYPYGLFIKMFDKNTGAEYYTNNLHNVLGHFSQANIDYGEQGNYITDELVFVPGPDESLSISMKDYSNANSIYIEQRESDYYFVVAHFPDDYFWSVDCDEYHGNKITIIDEVKIIFYKPIGRIDKAFPADIPFTFKEAREAQGNIFFTFENAEEVQGSIVFDYANLSNTDILKNLDNIQMFMLNNNIDFLKLEYSKEFYLEKLNEAISRIKNNEREFYIFPLDPFAIKHIMYDLLFLIDI